MTDAQQTIIRLYIIFEQYGEKVAIVKGPALSIMASGNLGSICYSKWGNLQVARSAWTGTVPNTTLQIGQQNYMTTCAQAWGVSLLEGERESWVKYAREVTFSNRFGEKVHYSGYVLFMSRNVRRLRWGYTITKVPLIYSKYMNWSTVLIQAEAAGNRVRYQATGYSTGMAPDLLEAWIAGPYDSPGRKPIEPEYKWVGVDKTVPFAIFKTGLIVGKYYWCRMRLGDKSGIVSSWETRQIVAI